VLKLILFIYCLAWSEQVGHGRLLHIVTISRIILSLIIPKLASFIFSGKICRKVQVGLPQVILCPSLGVIAFTILVRDGLRIVLTRANIFGINDIFWVVFTCAFCRDLDVNSIFNIYEYIKPNLKTYKNSITITING